MRVRDEPFGTTRDGSEVRLHTLEAGALAARITSYGASLVGLQAPDRDGEPADVVLGFETLAGYEGDNPCFGAVCGRFANRLAGGAFELDGTRYRVACNEGRNQLHGGPRGFQHRNWSEVPFEEAGIAGVRLTLESADGDQGFPGRLVCAVTYRLTEGALEIGYEATTTRPTPLSLTHHPYWNLAGHASGQILGHELTLGASHFTPVDAEKIPTGELREVAGGPFDFRSAKALGRDIRGDDAQLWLAGGYDHNFALDPTRGPAAHLLDAASGRVLEVTTSEPGVQVYTANGLAGQLRGKGDARYPRHAGVCLETQHFPDAPNQASFEATTLRPGETFRSQTRYRFSTV